MGGAIQVPSLNPPLFGSIDDSSQGGTAGVMGQGGSNPGVTGSSRNEDGVIGLTKVANKNGVVGRNQFNGAIGSLAGSDPIFHQHAGVYGQSDQQGVMGLSTSASGTGVYGGSTGAGGGGGIGVRGETSSGVGVQGQSFGSGLAGKFIGDVEVTGDIRLVNADCAEEFDISGADKIEPGTVMVLDQDGALEPSHQAYDKRVAGVISGAGDFRPGIVLDKQQCIRNRMPVALLGKVYCKADAQYSPIEVGDLLTTSPTLGHAMKADDPVKAFGSVIGKALRHLKEGQGLIPVLIALQ